MNTYVVWIEMDMARVFKIEVSGPECKVVRRHEMKHHTSRDPENHKDCRRFFGEVAQAIHDADEIFLVGPGLSKEHFKAYLLEHHFDALAGRIVGMETADRISDARILARSREFFRRYDVFGHAV